MRTILIITALLELAIISPIPALDRWQANYRAAVRASVGDCLPEDAHSAQERALLREIDALPDSPDRQQ